MMKNRRSLPKGLPKSHATGLEAYVNALESLFKDNLLSVVLYGSGARDEYVAGVSDLNVLVALEDENIRIVKGARTITQKAKRKYNIEPRFMSPRTIENMADVLPIAFLDMQERYMVLFGRDVLKDVSIKRDNLRFQCRSQLRFFRMRMRTIYVLSYPGRRRVMPALIRSFTSVIHILKALYWLMDEFPPSRPGEIISGTAVRFGLDEPLMNDLLDLKMKRRRFSMADMGLLFEAYIDFLDQMIQVVDQLPAEG